MTANYSTLPPPPPRPRTSRNAKIIGGFLIGGCLVVVVVVLVAVVVGGLFVAKNVKVSSTAAVPSDFPVYPRAVHQASVTVGGKDDQPRHRISMAQWTVRGGSGPVRQFYETNLSSGDWQILDRTSGAYIIARRSTGAVARLRVTDEFVQTVVQLSMTGDQPLEPGAHPLPTGVGRPPSSSP